MLGSHEQHEAAVALGDDLFLQVLRRLAAAEKRSEGVAQALSLLSQALPDRAELRRRAVHDLALVVDGRLDAGDLVLERPAPLDEGPERRERPGVRLPDGGARRIDRSEEGGEAAQLPRLEQPALDGQGAQSILDIGGALEGQVVGFEELDSLAGGRERRLDGARIRLRAQAAQGGGSERRQSQTADGLDDAIELQGPQRASVHAYIVTKRPSPDRCNFPATARRVRRGVRRARRVSRGG